MCAFSQIPPWEGRACLESMFGSGRKLVGWGLRPLFRVNLGMLGLVWLLPELPGIPSLLETFLLLALFTCSITTNGGEQSPIRSDHLKPISHDHL